MSNTIPKFDNLPGTILVKNDGGLAPTPGNPAPRALVIGTATSGQSNPYVVADTGLAKGEFGVEGTLTRGMYEASKSGAEEIVLYRIGATAAILEGVGGDAASDTGYTITTILKDDSAGGTYAVYYDDATDRLIVTNEDNELVVYDNDSTNPIDRFEVIVSGYRDAAGGGGPDIGTASSPVAMEDVAAVGTAYTAGTDGTSLSRMEMYEALYKAYKLLVEYDFDVVIPMDVYADDYNCVDQGNNKQDPETDNGANSYPDAGDFSPGTSVDALGKCYVEEHEGRYYFWWNFSGSGATADVWPAGIGSASSTTKIDGTVLTAGDFHEVNFAYQLAYFLFDYSTNNVDATGVIGTRPFDDYTMEGIATWIGTEPEYTLNTSTGEYYVKNSVDNGDGLLGFKFMAGRDDYRSGTYGGGFVATTTGWIDSGEELVDDNDYVVDIGKFISIVIDWPVLTNGYGKLSGDGNYIASYAPSYGGYYLALPPNSAPTNKKTVGASMYYKVGVRKMDKLAGRGYVVLREKPQGLVIADAPTASLPASDYKRLSTVRIVKAVSDAVRGVLEPYIGEATDDAVLASMKNAVDQELLKAKKAKYLKRYDSPQVVQTPDMSIIGDVDVGLVLVPAFETRQITVTISLTKE